MCFFVFSILPFTVSLPSQLCFGQTQGSIRWAALPNKRRQAPHEAGISCNSGGHLGFAKLSHFWGEGWVKQIHCPHEHKSCVIFTYCGLNYNYFYNLSKSLGNYWPKYWDKKKLKLICEIYPFPPSLLQLPLHWSLFWPDCSVTKSLLGTKRERHVLCSFHQIISVFSDWKAHSPKQRARKLTCSGLREVFQKPFWNLDRKE